ncbi:MAG: aminotransferase class III-fold pyridoxal phosphate-dependent enzyme, partial [Planctomycetales bacterium]|nr:aminotransferase class III-fold pyridoxal phosphate-dependent enzyme [Planctomycetales bacterium]
MSNHDRLTGATSALAKILSEASGFDLHELDQQSTFLELGFDSLFLIQFSQKIKNQMKVKVSFRQLIEELPSIDALVQYLSVHAPDEVLLQTTKPAEVNPVVSATEAVPSDAPAVAVDAPALPQFSVPTETSVGEKCSNQASSPFSTALMPGIDGSASPISRAGLEQVIMQQNQLMALQLQMLCASKPLAVTEATQPAASPPVGTNSLRPVSAVPARIAGAEDAQKPAQADPTPHGVPRNQAKGEPQAEPQQKKLFERFGPYKPVRREQGGLNAPQQASLDEFVARFTAKTVRSRAHAQLHRRHFADPRGVAGYRRIWKSIVYQIAVERSAGSKLWDIDGNEYIDIAMGFGLNLFGQSPPFITEALHRQLDLGVEVGPQSPLAGEVAQLLCDFSRKERATFCNTGSEAVMAAMRLARTVTGKSKIVFFNKDYHGNFDEVLLRSNPSGGQLRTSPAAPGIPQTLADNAIVLNYGAAESLRVIEEYADEIAAVLVEPVQSADPFNQPREFLHEIRRITRERNIAMIMDEVITGFRAGQG